MSNLILAALTMIAVNVGATVQTVSAYAIGARAPVAVGWAFHYHPPHARERVCHSMECVYLVRRARDQIAPRPARIDALVSLPTCGTLGSIVVFTIHHRVFRGYQVDCSDPRHRQLQRARGLVIETDWRTAALGHWAVYGGLHGDGKARAVVWSVSAPVPYSKKKGK